MCDQKVSCGICSKDHVALHQGSEDGYGCASEVSQGEIHSAFGSDFDLSVHKIIGDDLTNGLTVCDACIASMLESGRIVPARDIESAGIGHGCLEGHDWTDVSGLVLKALAA